MTNSIEEALVKKLLLPCDSLMKRAGETINYYDLGSETTLSMEVNSSLSDMNRIALFKIVHPTASTVFVEYCYDCYDEPVHTPITVARDLAGVICRA